MKNWRANERTCDEVNMIVKAERGADVREWLQPLSFFDINYNCVGYVTFSFLTVPEDSTIAK